MSGVVDGEYDARRSEISVRRRAADGTIAHELVHALQDQNFGLGVPVTDVDMQLARMALIEGDASWTELLLIARTSRRAVSYVPDRPSMMFPEADRYELDESEKLWTLVVSPYTAGALFCGNLRRFGGVSLLNEAYGAPPQTTEQVLHVEKYLAREQPIAVRVPEPVHDQEVVARGRVGELLLRTTLLSCNRATVAERAAAGWGGDAFVLTARPGFYTLTLATVWDSVEDAVEFEDAMRRTAACWDVREPIDGDYDGRTLVRRGGRTVVVIRGNGPYARGAVLAGPDQ